jgi:Flp pilus assembly protein TadD
VNLFVGRVAEQERFRDILRQLGSENAAEPEMGFVVVVHGHGGSGKTRLLGQFKEIAAGEPDGTQFVVAAVDWEQERRLHRTEFAGLAGPPVWRVLDRLYRAVVDAMSGSSRGRKLAERAFHRFRKGTIRLPELLERARQLGLDEVLGRQRLSAENRTALAEATGLGLKLTGVDAGTSATLGRLAVATSAKVKGVWSAHAEPEAYASLTSAVDNLVRSFAAGLAFLARKGRPVVAILDTCEVLGDACDWLPEVMRRAGARTVWVVGMRHETSAGLLEDDVLARFQPIADQQRLATMPLAPFDEQEMRDYLDDELGDRLPDGVTFEQVAQMTRGVPLAAYLVTRMLRHGHPPETVFGDAAVNRPARQIVGALIERYLVHVRDTPQLASDLPLIQGLALLLEDRTDPHLLGALWEMPSVEVADRLARLSRQHDFVLSTSRMVHGDVANAIRHYLLGPAERESVRPANERAVACLRARMAAESPDDVEGQLSDDAWCRDATSLLWHTYWVDPRRGLRLLCHLFPAAAFLNAALAENLITIGSYFRSLHTTVEQHTFDGVRYLAERRFLPPQERNRHVDLSAVLAAITATTTDPVLSDSIPAEAFVDLLAATNGDLFGINDNQRITRMNQAADRVPVTAATTRNVVETYAVLLAHVIMGGYFDRSKEPAITKLILDAATTAVTVASGKAAAYACLGLALAQLERWPDAESAFTQAARLDPTSVSGNDIWGLTLRKRGRNDDAITVHRQAVREHPDSLLPHTELAHLLLIPPAQKPGPTPENVEEALGHLRTAIRLDPNDVHTHITLSEALIRTGDHATAEQVARRAVTLRRDAQTLNSLGLVLIQQGRGDKAEPLFREAVALSPDIVHVHIGLGVALCAQRREPRRSTCSAKRFALIPVFIWHTRT